MTRRSPTALAGAAFIAVLALATSAWADRTALVNMTHSFPPGPYSAISVDPSNPDRIAVATEKGEVSFSVDGGLASSDTRAILNRRYDAMAIRAGSRAGLSLARPAGGRATRLFLYQLREGLPTPRWAHWMAIGQPVTSISDIALPVGRDLFVAGPHGIVIGQDNGAAWQRLLGGPGSMQREKDMMGMSVVIDPTDPNHILAATDQGVFVSYDRGYNFQLMRSKALRDRFITRWFWDRAAPDLLFAIDTYEVLLSDDKGVNFESVFSAGSEIHDVSMAGESVFISTKEGLYIVGPDGTRHVLKKHDVLGAIGREDGSTIAITKDTFWWIGPDDRLVRIAQTSSTDPYMRLVGTGSRGWILSRHTVLRIGSPLERRRTSSSEAPKLTLSLRQVERAVLKNTGLGKPKKTRLRERWFSKFLPRLEVTAYGEVNRRDELVLDPTRAFPFSNAYAYSNDQTMWTVMAFWDLQRLIPRSNASNPYAFIESNLRANRKAMLDEVRWRYREAAALAAQLQRAPSDPMLEAAWRSRLAEYVAYLEFMSGREILSSPME